MDNKNFLKIGLSLFIVLCISCAEDKNKKSEYTIENTDLKVRIKSFGAELTSIKKDSKEYLWQGNPEFWDHQSPILFPLVGRLVDHEYFFDSKTYPMNFHGFAWKKNFKLIKRTVDSIVFELTSNTETKKNYPFDFVLQISYSLIGTTLKTEYLVKNSSKNEVLFFSIGGHPAFNCPLDDSHKRNEYAIVFDKKLSPKSQDKISGLRTNTNTQAFKTKGQLILSDTLFNQGALIFNPNPFNEATLQHIATQKSYLTVRFDNFPYLGIWSQKNSGETPPFVCIEPWYGIADHTNHNKNFKTKEGILNLEPTQEFSCSYTIKIH